MRKASVCVVMKGRRKCLENPLEAVFLGGVVSQADLEGKDGENCKPHM